MAGFLDFQLGFFLAVVGVAVGVVDNSLGFGLGVFATQVIKQFDQAERQRSGQDRSDDDVDG